MLSETDLLTRGQFDTRRYAKKLIGWSSRGFPEMTPVKGLGTDSSTIMIISDTDFEDTPDAVSRRTWKARGQNLAGNGAVARCPIMAVCNLTDPRLTLGNVAASTIATHYDPRCVLSSWTVATICRQLVLGTKDSSEIFSNTFGRCCEEAELLTPISHTVFKPRSRDVIDDTYMRPEGYDLLGEYSDYMKCESLADLRLNINPDYTFKAMACGVMALARTDFIRAITETAMEGGSASGNCATVGAVIGSRIGYSGLPKAWLDAMNDDGVNYYTEILLTELSAKSHPNAKPHTLEMRRAISAREVANRAVTRGQAPLHTEATALPPAPRASAPRASAPASTSRAVRGMARH